MPNNTISQSGNGQVDLKSQGTHLALIQSSIGYAAAVRRWLTRCCCCGCINTGRADTCSRRAVNAGWRGGAGREGGALALPAVSSLLAACFLPLSSSCTVHCDCDKSLYCGPCRMPTLTYLHAVVHVIKTLVALVKRVIIIECHMLRSVYWMKFKKTSVANYKFRRIKKY